MKRATSYMFIAIAFFMLTQACTSSKRIMTFESGTIDSDRYVRKVDQFVVIADGSLSMADRWQRQTKIGISEGLLQSFNQTVPELGFEGALRTFGRGLCGEKGKTLEIIAVSGYNTSSFGDGVARYSCANGYSPLNLALAAAGTDLADHSRPTAIIIVSDGLHMNKKEVQAAATLKEAFGDHLDIYVIQVGNDTKGRALLEDVVAAGGEGYVKGVDELTTSLAMAEYVSDVFLYPDDDGDGVPNHLDECPETAEGVAVDANGCPPDSDGDGVPDYLDKCPGTPKGVTVDTKGCPPDSDGDGVPDYLDKCPGTPRSVKVDAKGCPLDSDGDGVSDYLDKCPGTPRGVPVDKTGCPPAGIEVVGDEWMVRGKVLFDINRATIKPEAGELLGRIATFLQENPQYVVEIQGNTDSTGPKTWNMQLSEMRAESVREFLVDHGVADARLTTKGFGSNEPIVPNDTAENRAKNRRVDFKPTTL